MISPRLLELAYSATLNLLRPIRGWLRPGGIAERAFVVGEIATKGPLFGCQMCGQCVLHSTGMTCPMNCPKQLRNGPCGGVRLDGKCEVRPEMTCVWLQAWERSKQMPRFGGEFLRILPPVDQRLQGSSAWINHFSGSAERLPVGWEE